MKRCLIVGRPNVGKTTFLLNFAVFLGLRGIPVGGGKTPLPPSEARARLVDPRPHTTLQLQVVQVRLPGAKGRRVIELVDSTGLDDEIAPDPLVRAGMAETLRALRASDLVLHLVDAAEAGVEGPAVALGQVDRQIARFAPLRGSYAVLANKMDLPWARSGLLKVRDEFPERTVIPISALEGSGFREVRAFVWERA